MAAPSDNSIEQSSQNSLDLTGDLTGEGVIIDIGTGDGRFVYQSARQNPKKFYIGIDPNVRPLAKISEKTYRKPSKGGAPNVLFVQAAVEDLPAELDGVADEVHVHFPWGSLLRAVATGDVVVLRNLRRICSAGALLEVVMGLDPLRDQSEIERLGLEPLTVAYIDEILASNYAAAGFEITERGIIAASEWPEFNTSWAKRLQQGEQRTITYLISRAV
ncbi:MAG TPA: methyltransferase domain-containing protein [Pyrinomonadaceae bacterium]|nr:methyltransferase domain-containing protein [Pyrinomonadaceae bacterium]